MWNFQRIICIWICCVSCMFGTTQLSSLVAAVPYEYFDDHDQSFYDLDTEQIQAKYDTRLLSQQMLKTQEQQQQHNSKKGSHTGEAVGAGAVAHELANGRSHDASFVSDKSTHNDGYAGSSNILTKLKSNEASKNNNKNDNVNNNNNNKANDWLDETTAAITENQEIHLPRAASCYTNGQKYTHGQKVPRHDSCEVCLCMDGEIFCWWEKCEKKPPKSETMRYDDYSTPFEESSTVRMQANVKSTVRTTLKPMKKPKINKDYKYDQDDEEDNNDGDDDDDEAAAAAADENDEYDDIKQRHSKSPYKSHNKQMAKKKIFGEQQEALELKEKQMKMAKLDKLKKQQQQQQHKTNNDHRYHHPEHHPSSGSSKILNFPENLPSVLYYDYKTEEHQHHQHQHREQHLKHQHEKELKHRQRIVGRHHEYGDDVGQDFNTNRAVTAAAAAVVATSLRSGRAGGAGGGRLHDDDDDDVVLQRQQQPLPLSAKYLGNGNDNIYNVDLQTDSDILPEPPTKKPKLPTIATASASASASSAATQTTTLSYRSSTLPGTALANSAATTRPLKKQMFSPWDYGKPNRDKVNNSIKQRQQQQQHSDKSPDEDVVVDEDQDDAFHRWLTSTEKNNKNNGAQVGDAGFAGINDFEGDDKMYENIDIDAVSLQATTKPPTAAPSTALAGEGSQNFENSGNLKYEINFSDTNTGSTDTTNNNNIDNISPFSNPYQNYKNNNNPTLMTTDGKTPSASDGPLSSSNEDNGVGSVVNIDIMLTASADMAQQTDAKTQQHQPSSDYDKQIPGQPSAKQKPLLISNTNEKDNGPLSLFSSLPTTNANCNRSIDGGDTQQTLGGNLSSSNFSNTNGSTSNNSSSHNNNNSFSSSDSYKSNQPMVTNSTGASSAESAALSQTTPTTSTTLSPERQCNVMGTLYKIGDVLPQDTGNCLQCICIDGSTMDDTPRVTCSPHNCPPLVLPDLFDATGY